MKSNWKKVKLSDICDVRDGTHDSPKRTAEGRFLITSKHIKGGKIDLSSAYKISLKDFDMVNQRSKVDQWDILLSMIGTIGEVCIVKEEPDFAIKNVGLIKTNDEILSLYLYYYLKTPTAQSDILARLKGTTQQYLSLGEIRSFPISIPQDDRVMRKITKILSSIDDKIELNNKINRNLEAQAQAIFKSWFVDTQNLDRKLVRVRDFFDISIGKTPPRKEPNWFSDNDADVPWVSISDMGDCGTFISYTSEYLTKEAISMFNIRLVPDNTVLLSFKLTIGRIAITDGEMATNEAIAHFISNDKYINEYLYCYLKNFNFQTIGNTSSIAIAVNSKIIKDMPFTLPTKEEVMKFHSITNPIFNTIKSNQRESNRLANIRNALLPKLISGEFNFSNIEA